MHASHKFAVTALVSIVVLAGIGAPLFLRAQHQRQRETCLDHLQQINEPLNCCIPLESKLTPGDAIDQSLVPGYFKSGVLPRCPSGALYMIPFVAGGRPVCPIHGDLLSTVTNIKVLGLKPIYPAGFRHE